MQIALLGMGVEHVLAPPVSSRELLLVSVAGRPVDLSPLEYKLLWILIEEDGRPVAREPVHRHLAITPARETSHSAARRPAIPR